MGSCTASLVVASVKLPQQCQALLARDLTADLPHVRVEAVQKVQAVWRNRYQVCNAGILLAPSCTALHRSGPGWRRTARSA